MDRPVITPEDVLKFWFEDADRQFWWRPNPDFDRLVFERFGDLLLMARRCELYPWRRDAGGRLAEILILDQFARHIYRDRPEAFASDALALALAQTAVEAGVDEVLPLEKRAFLYLPYIHSESPIIHEVGVGLLSQQGLEASLASALRHKAVIDRFGRFPHRNAVLGRASTAEELTFLEAEGRGF